MGPVMSATENHYEDIGPDSDIVRNMIRTESQVLFLLKKILSPVITRQLSIFCQLYEFRMFYCCEIIPYFLIFLERSDVVVYVETSSVDTWLPKMSLLQDCKLCS